MRGEGDHIDHVDHVDHQTNPNAEDIENLAKQQEESKSRDLRFPPRLGWMGYNWDRSDTL